MPDPVNLPMECLCCLPKSPYVARVREIAEDLGVTIGAVKVAIDGRVERWAKRWRRGEIERALAQLRWHLSADPSSR
ncbi:MAG: hypothetical protein ABSC47_13540 [Terracidiphilus sp.]